jgi:hypothetical protein
VNDCVTGGVIILNSTIIVTCKLIGSVSSGRGASHSMLHSILVGHMLVDPQLLSQLFSKCRVICLSSEQCVARVILFLLCMNIMKQINGETERNGVWFPGDGDSC